MFRSRILGTFIALTTSSFFPLICLASPQSETFLKQADCRNFVRNNDANIILGSKLGIITIDNQGRQTLYKLEHNVRDALLANHQIFVLADSEIIRIDTASGNETGRAPTQNIKPSDQLLAHEKPRAIGLYDNLLVVAHGTLGVAVFDQDTLEFKNLINLDTDQKVKSLAQDIAVKDDSIYVLADNFQINPVRPNVQFRGILELDIDQAKILNRFSGLDPGVTALARHEDAVLVSFGGNPVWKLRTPLNSNHSIQKGSRLLTDLVSHGRLVGHFSLDDQYVWSCHRTKGRDGYAPAIFERSALGI